MDLLFASCLAFLLGTLWGAEFPLDARSLALLTCVYALTWTTPLRAARRGTALLVCAGIGVSLAGSALPPQLGGPPRMVTVTGRVLTVAMLATETRVTLRSPDAPYAPDLRVHLRFGSEAEVGSTLTVRGKLLPPRDRDAHLAAAAQGVRGSLLDATVLTATPGAPGPLLRLRRAVERHLTALHPGDIGALLAGLLTGGRSAFSESGQEDVRRTGLAHLVAISGANFVLLIGLCERLLHGLPRRVRLALLAALTLVFWLFVDGGMAVARAAVATLAVIGAAAIGRPGGGLRALVYASVALCVFSPLALRADASLQLSVLATMGVLLVGGFDGLRTPSPLDWKQTLAMSVATTLATLPVQFVRFGSLSLIAPLTNLVALPLVPLAMGAGFAELALAWVPGLGLVLHGLAACALGGILLVATLGAQVSFATTDLPTLPAWSHALVLTIGFGTPLFALLRKRG